ncbi:phage tail protein [Montanilutibacter psychrotolerans]|uniref:Phage tail protein n=1 Tax=Montanilutibacter psychrotolerans TaxID=1327343 RepID=A0A3M8T708_9GAMM|nr:tail fiber protein [Lysobacter psychrotolerans]RNF86432.1 phage tail protein [Lysobacter psychrotolerans]
MSQPYVGEIRIFGFSRVPNGWFSCDGSLQPISEYEVLFTLIGTTYGGDGQSTFALPDLRGQLPLHWGTGQGLTTRVIGEGGGSESVTLTQNQMPAHSHAVMATTATASATAIGPTVTLGSISPDTMYVTDLAGATQVTLAPASVTPAGGTQPHDNLMPTLTVQYCIAWAGIFPSQS